MNPTLAPIFARRSVRKFARRPVPASVVRDLLEAAMAAPSDVETDPWHFIVVRDPARLRRISAGLPHGKLLARAPLGIVVLGDMDRANGRLESYLLQDVSAAIENLLLAASMLGFGACWLGVHLRANRMAHVRRLVDLPPAITPIAVVALGSPAERPPARTRFREAAVHRERW